MTAFDTVVDRDLDDLDAGVIGPVLAGSDLAAAGEAATFNLAIVHHPAVVVGAACAEDVAVAVAWAVEHDLPVAVQATGHGAVTPADGAMLITTQRMRAVSIDPVRRTARADAGTRWRDVIDAAAIHGLAPLAGSSSQVGVVGYTLGGGIGLLARQYGFAADLVRSVTLVGADGIARVVDAASDPELFWAVRGGKGNFGIVTEIEFGLVEISELYTGSIFFAVESATDVLTAYQAWAPGLPERTTTSIAVLRLPPLETVPPPLRGRTVVHLRYAHNGAPAEGEHLLASMLRSGVIVAQAAGSMPFALTDAVHHDPTQPVPILERTTQLRELSDDAVKHIIAAVGSGPDAALFMVEVRQLGGALARQPAVPNAVAGRDGAYAVVAFGVLVPGGEDTVRAAEQRLMDDLRPWASGTALVNFLGDATTPQDVARAWTPDVHARLLRVKERVDPGNVFRFGHALV
jgi:FAD/FMN-containing dehydrogenase